MEIPEYETKKVILSCCPELVYVKMQALSLHQKTKKTLKGVMAITMNIRKDVTYFLPRI